MITARAVPVTLRPSAFRKLWLDTRLARCRPTMSDYIRLMAIVVVAYGVYRLFGR
jgi:hypothetical protein